MSAKLLQYFMLSTLQYAAIIRNIASITSVYVLVFKTQWSTSKGSGLLHPESTQRTANDLHVRIADQQFPNLVEDWSK